MRRSSIFKNWNEEYLWAKAHGVTMSKTAYINFHRSQHTLCEEAYKALIARGSEGALTTMQRKEIS